jgi:tetratricopeptide (TPR) repeat protein
MKTTLFRKEWRLFAACCCLCLLSAAPALAQRGEGNEGGRGGKEAGRGAPAGPTITDPKEADAFKAYLAAKGDKRIAAGNQFLDKYPKSVAAKSVADQIASLEYNKQDWTGFYAAADKALAIDPNDLGVLTLDGWIIARNYKPGQTSPTLDDAEKDCKHALDLVAALQKPASLTDEQFAQLKAAAAAQAHSGLGLAYAKENKPDQAAAELVQVTNPDATDIFMLAASYETLGKHVEAAQEFKKCSTMSGPLQAPCTQGAADTAKEGPDAAQ